MFSLLYVDDEPGLLDIGQLFLENTGEFTVRTVQSGKEALDLLSHNNFDAVISDYQMPEMDGLELLKRVRKTYGTLPFVLFTGRGREEIIIEAINNGVDSYLQKGGDPQTQFAELAHRIRQAIRRRRAEIALSDSERRFKDIINFLPDATFAIDTEGHVIAWNRAIEEMTGIPASAMLGKGDYEYAAAFYGSRRPVLIDLVFEPDEKIVEYYVNIRRDGNTISAETSLPRPKGRRIDALAKASPLYNRDGEISGAIESIRDISDRKRSEEELRAANEHLATSGEELQVQYNELAESERRIRESESRLGYMIGFYERARKRERELLDYAVEGAGIVTGSPLGYLAFLNKDESEMSMYAWSKAAMTECTMQEKPIVYRTEKTGLWGEAVRQRRPVITNNYDAPDPAKKGYPEGHPRIVRHMNVPVIEDGHIVLVAGVANKPSDYTDHDAHELVLLMQGLWSIIKRKRAEETQQESEARYRSLVEHAPAGMHFYDLKPDGTLVFTGANPGADRILGIDHSLFFGKPIEDIFPGLTGTDVPEHFRRVAAEGGIWQTEQLNYDSGTIHGAYAVTAFQISAGSMVTMFTDITERRRTETELRAAYEQITASEEELREQYNELSSAQGELRNRKQQMEEIAATVPGVIFQFYARPDGSMGVYYVSGRAVEILGIDKNTGEFFPAFVDGVHPEERTRLMNSFNYAVKTSAPWEFEGRFIKPSGETIWFRGVSSPVRHGDELLFSGVIQDITSQKQADLALREERNFTDAILDSIPGLFYLYNDEGRLIRWNRNHETVTGYSADELKGMHVLDWYKGDEHDTAVIKAGVEKALREGFASAEANLTTKSGKKIPFYFTAVMLDTGGRKYFTGIGIDLTGRKKAEAELSSHQQQMAEIAATVPGVVFQFYARPDGSTGIYYVSTRSEEIFGFDNSTTDYFRWFTDHLHPDDKARFLASVQDAVRTVKRWVFEGRFTRPSGEIIWFRGISSPVIHGDELVYSGVLLDITEQKQTEEILRESEEKYRSLIETTNTGYVILDDAGKVLDANPEYVRLTGHHDLSEIAGHSVVEWTAEYEQEKNAAAVRQCVHDGFIRNFEIDYTDSAGNITPLEINATVVHEEGKSRIITLCREITDRKRAEKALAESERKYRLLAENSPDMIYFIDAWGYVKYVNGYAALNMRTKPGDLVGKHLTDLFSPGNAQRHFEAIQSVVTSRQSSQQEMYEVLPAGGTWLEVRLSPLIDENGAVLGVLGLSHDISDRKNAEEALSRLSRTDREALDVAHMGHFEFDVATRAFIFNDQYFALIGTTAEKAGGYRMTAAQFSEQFVHPENVHLVQESIEAGIKTTDPRFERRFESRIIRPDGTTMWVEVWFRIEKDPVGKTVRFYGVNQDITERKHAENALHESEMKYRMLVDSSNDIIYSLQTDGTITFVSPSWTVLLGHPAEKVVGRSFHQFIHPDDIPACDAFLATVVKTRERKAGIVYRVIHADGSIHIHTSNVSPVMDEKGTVVSYIGNARDITDMKRSENAIRESNRKLNLLNSITRHDLANQLTVVQGYTQLAMIRKPDPVIAEFLAKIDQAAEVMARQIEFTRNYQDLGVQAPAWHKVTDIVMAAKPQNIALTCACDNCEVFADPMIDKVFFNLFDNAIRHGGKVTVITVQCGVSSDELVITVEDNGIGVPLDEKQKIFEKGYGKHTGFGLFLVREILAITGIFIHETGAHGRGARFEIAIPKGAYRRVKKEPGG